MEKKFELGDIVYVFYRNPHTQDVANIQEAKVMNDPENPSGLAVFLYETYYPLTTDMAIFSSREEADQIYQQCFGSYIEGVRYE